MEEVLKLIGTAKGTKPFERDRIDRLERKMDYAINFLDRDYLKLLNRVERIEEHLNLDPIII